MVQLRALGRRQRRCVPTGLHRAVTLRAPSERVVPEHLGGGFGRRERRCPVPGAGRAAWMTASRSSWSASGSCAPTPTLENSRCDWSSTTAKRSSAWRRRLPSRRAPTSSIAPAMSTACGWAALPCRCPKSWRRPFTVHPSPDPGEAGDQAAALRRLFDGPAGPLEAPAQASLLADARQVTLSGRSWRLVAPAAPVPPFRGPGAATLSGNTAAATLEGVADAARSTRTVGPFISIIDRVVAFLPATQAVGAAQRR